MAENLNQNQNQNHNDKQTRNAPGKGKPQDNLQIQKGSDQNRGENAVKHDVKVDNNKKKNNQNNR